MSPLAPRSVADVPARVQTPVRSVRVPDVLWARIQKIAHERDVSVTDVVIDALTRYERRRR